MDDVINFKIYYRLSSKTITDMEKRREDRKVEYLENGKSFLDETKRIFNN